jgi:hypothetical protein
MEIIKVIKTKIRTALPLLFLSLWAALLPGYASAQQDIAEAHKAHIIPGKQIHLTDMRGSYRFCEIGLITGTSPANAIANIYNTSGTFDPTPEQFAALDAEKFAKETDSLKVWLNPVRHWAMDE